MGELTVALIIVALIALGAAYYYYRVHNGCVRCVKDPSGWVYAQARAGFSSFPSDPKWEKGKYCLSSDGSKILPWGVGNCMSGSSIADCNSKISSVVCPLSA